MSSNLLDPLIANSLKGVKPVIINNYWRNFSMSKFILNIVLPVSIFLFIVFCLKLKWDKKYKQNIDIPI